MERNVEVRDPGHGEGMAEDRRDLARRLDDLRGLGVLPAWSETLHVEGENALLKLSLSLIDLLETSQRRVIETSIQLLSLRELVSGLLNMRTPEEVARTVTMYLHKAFDHERVLMAVAGENNSLHGWVAVRRGSPRFGEFTLEDDWDGALRDVLASGESLRSWQDESLRPLLEGKGVPPCLDPFLQGAVGPFMVFPLLGAQAKVMGVVAVARGFGSSTMEGMDADILQSLVEAVSTAMENMILDADVRREEAFRQDIMGSMTSGMVAVDMQGRVLTQNPRAETMTGYPLTRVIREDTRVLGSDRHSVHNMLKDTLVSRSPLPRTEIRLRRADGSDLPVACGTTLLRNPQGEAYGAVATFEDLTAMKAMEERIRQLDRMAALGRFTAGVAHEIRNPLAGIGAGVQYLAKHLAEEPDQVENLDFIQREIQRLNRIVEDLFRVTHPLPPRTAPERPDRLVDRALRCLVEPASDHSVSLSNDVPGDLPDVPVDADQIEQVLLNLIKNGVEAAEGGEVTVSASVDEADGVLCLVVSDTGPGLAPETLPHVFEPFFTQGKAEGTGLGLYVSHGIAERHGGELIAGNTPRGGARFTLRLPLTRIDSTEIAG